MKGQIRVSIKESSFKTEPAFTMALANNSEWMSDILDEIGVTMDEDCTFVPEYSTRDNKRIDIVVKDSDGKVTYPIECMDSKGKLDMEHATKIRWYMRDVDCTTGIILCESADEYVQRHIREDNAKSDLDVWVLIYNIIETDGNPFLTFNVLVSPSEFLDKRKTVMSAIDKSSSKKNSNARDEMEARYKDTGLFTNPQAGCTAYNFNNVNHENYDTSIGIPFPGLKDVSFFNQKNGSKICFYHAKKLRDNEEFSEMMDMIAKDHGLEPIPNSNEIYFKFKSEEEGLKMFRKLKAQGFKPTNA
jgi:hypothetical protein|tara:strand:+ start:133 stop:1038 length:906 start_codon:yes stop_codon:yes gene_type:complete